MSWNNWPDWIKWGIWFIILSVIVDLAALFVFLGGEKILFTIFGTFTYVLFVFVIPAIVISPGLLLVMIDLGMRGAPASILETLTSWFIGSMISIPWAFLLGALLSKVFGKKNNFKYKRT